MRKLNPGFCFALSTTDKRKIESERDFWSHLGHWLPNQPSHYEPPTRTFWKYSLGLYSEISIQELWNGAWEPAL